MPGTALLQTPIVDAHIHLNHLEKMDDVVALLDKPVQ